MDIQEKAAKLHETGFNCAQSVLAACGEYTGLEESMALAAAAGFGGGMRSGEICGAISGAVMALGLVKVKNPENPESKTEATEPTKKIINAFGEKYGCVRCRDLKQSGISCDELIAFACRFAEKALKEE